MASGKSNYLDNKILDGVLGGISGAGFPLPANVYIALSTALFDPTATGAAMTEVSSSGTAYSRVAVTNNTTNWPSASSQTKSNGTVFTFPTATASWGTVVSVYIVDASTSGNILYGADLTASRSVASGDTASFAASAIVITEA